MCSHHLGAGLQGSQGRARAGSPHAPGAHSAAGAPAPPWCAQDPTAAEQLGSAGGRSRRPRELPGKGQAPGRGHQEPPYGPCVLPRQLSLKITLGVQSPGADGRETGKSGKICFVSTPRLKLAERRGGCWSSEGGAPAGPGTALAPDSRSTRLWHRVPRVPKQSSSVLPGSRHPWKAQGEASRRAP